MGKSKGSETMGGHKKKATRVTNSFNDSEIFPFTEPAYKKKTGDGYRLPIAGHAGWEACAKTWRIDIRTMQARMPALRPDKNEPD